MKVHLFKYSLLGIFLLLNIVSCKDRKSDNEIRESESVQQQERMYDNPDPLNERDASGGTIDNHQENTASQATQMNDTVGIINPTSKNNHNTQEN